MNRSTPVHDLSTALAALGADLCRRVPDLAHIHPERVLFCLSRSRAAGSHGVYARIVPLRFAEGQAEFTRHRGRHVETFRMPALHYHGREILYLIYIMVPRFFRLSFEQKLGTIIHELFHISEACDGDIRRYPGRNFAHGSSRRAYDRKIAELTRHYLQKHPAPALSACLSWTEEQWLGQEFRLTGLRIPLPRPRLIAREKV
jgi:hypothetical protein